MVTVDAHERRTAVAAQIGAMRGELAGRITDEFLRRHPEWLTRYGAAARKRGEEDAAFHLDFLAGALLSGDTTPFEEYALWTSGVLSARGIDPGFLVENLEQVRDHVVASLDGPGRDWVHEYVGAGVRAIQRGQGEATEESPHGLSSEARLYLDAVLKGDRKAALGIALEAHGRGAGVPEIYQEILTPAQREVGNLWARSDISVATEHMATAITQYVVAQLYPHFDMPDPTRGHAVVTGVERELHQLGGHMVADMLEHDGWNVRFLGSHLPSSQVVEALAEHEASLLVVSATVLPSVTAVSELIERTRGRFGDEMRILVGGRAFAVGTWQEIGADGIGSSLQDAVDLARRLSA